MNNQLNNILKRYNYNIGIYAIDSYNNEIKYNENNVFESASCIKLFILIEYYRQISQGLKTREDIFIYNTNDKKKYLDIGILGLLDSGIQMSSRNYAILMIAESDNVATNKLIEYLGIDNINNTIKSLGLKKTKLLNELDFSKYKRFGHTTPYEYALAYKMILDKKLFDNKISEEMLSILKKQRHNDMLTKGLPLRDVLFRGNREKSKINYIASKSGSVGWDGNDIDNVRNDGGIISTIYGDYIVSIFISKFDDMYFYYNNEAINCGSEINQLIFNKYIENGGMFNE